MIAKYRGLTLDTKQWVYGYYCQVEEKHLIITNESRFDYEDEEGYNVIFRGLVEVAPESVGQFIGLLDKNGKGKEAYHKDICSYKDDSGKLQKGIVEWSDTQARFYIEAIGGDEEGNQDGDLDRWFEVIGNAFQDKDLLKGERE